MKLGTPAASPFEELAALVLPRHDVFESDEAIAAAAAAPLDEEEAFVFWDDLKKATSRRRVYASANAARLERELTARFGIFKGVATHPYTLRVVQIVSDWSQIRLMGPPVVALHAAVVILFMAYRGKMPLPQFVLLSCFLFRVHPVLVVAGGLVTLRLKTRKRLPKPYYDKKKKSKASSPPPQAGPCLPVTSLEEDAATLIDRLATGSLGTASCSEVDVAFEGGRLLSRLYAGALSAKAGLTVAVKLYPRHDDKELELRPKKAPCFFPGASDWRFGQFASKYRRLIDAALLDGDAVEWVPVGDADDGYAYAIRVFDRGDPVVLRAGPEAFVEAAFQASRVERPKLLHVLQQAMLVANDVSAHCARRLSPGAAAADGTTSSQGAAKGATTTTTTTTTSKKSSAAPPSANASAPPAAAPTLGMAVLRKAGLVAPDAVDASRGGSVFAAAESYETPAALVKLCAAPGAEDSQDAALRFALDRLACVGSAGVAKPEPPATFGAWCFGASHALAGFERPADPKALAAALVRTILAYGGAVEADDVATTAARVVRLGGSSSSSKKTTADKPPPRTLIAFDGDAASLEVPVTGLRVVADDFVCSFSHAATSSSASEHVATTACVVEHHAPRLPAPERVLDDVAALFPRTRGCSIFACRSDFSAGTADDDEAAAHRRGGPATPSSPPAEPVADADDLPGAAGDLVAGWLAAHHACRYTAFDLLALHRNLLTDLPNLPPLKPPKPPATK